MNIRLTGFLMGVMMLFEGFLLIIPLTLSLCFKEDIATSYLLPLLITLAVGIPLVLQRPKNRTMKAKGGLVTVALCWVAMSVVGSLPYIISGTLPSFVDALFETVSGFTTTGSTMIVDVEAVAKSLLLWRSLTQFAGGMGILCFVIAILPRTDGTVYQVFKAESPGPQKGKLVSKITITARILYILYTAITLLLVLFLVFGKVPVYDSFVIALSATSTGGFTHLNASIASYNSVYVDIVLTVFTYLASLNFTLFFLLIMGKFKDVIKSEELRWFTCIVVGASMMVALSLLASKTYDTFAACLRYSFASVTTYISTTGYVFTDTGAWPAFSQFVLILVMFVGGCAGSTAGGLKVSRIILLSKSGGRLLKGGLNSQQILNVKMDGKIVEKDVVHNAFRYLMLYIVIWIVSVLILMATTSSYTGKDLFLNSIGAVTTCLNNVGTAIYGVAGGNLSQFSILSKLTLTLNMLLGRLEILPVLMLFVPHAWKKY